MRTKVTLTLDQELVPAAKRFARSRRVSLSRLIEESLRELTGSEGPSFAQRWRGAFRPAQRRAARYRRLAAKYL